MYFEAQYYDNVSVQAYNFFLSHRTFATYYGNIFLIIVLKSILKSPFRKSKVGIFALLGLIFPCQSKGNAVPKRDMRHIT